VTAELLAIALVAGIAGGALAGIAIGAAQAWMGRARSGQRAFTLHPVGAPPVARPQGATSGPFDRFDEAGKRVLALAQDEAIRQNHNYIGTEHLLAALLREPDTIAGRALASLGVDLTKVRTALEFIVGRGDTPTSPSDITLSPRTKKVIELAIDEGRKLGHRQVGPEHILLGVVREGEGIASGILESLGLPLETVRARVLELLNPAA
jgi:ATP-dependent Clp protease ATP-binding subunit ClpC